MSVGKHAAVIGDKCFGVSIHKHIGVSVGKCVSRCRCVNVDKGVGVMLVSAFVWELVCVGEY